MLNYIGRVLLILGIAFMVVGLILMLKINIPLLGKLPGDIYMRKGNFIFYLPLTSCILISIVVTLILRIFGK